MATTSLPFFLLDAEEESWALGRRFAVPVAREEKGGVWGMSFCFFGRWIQLVAATPLILKYFMGGIAYGANQPADADGRREGRALAAVAEG
jgi:hypothetical protein